MAEYVHIPLFFVWGSCILFLLAAWASRSRQFCSALFLSLVIFFAGFLHLGNARTYPVHHISNFVADSPQKVYFRAKVVSNPEVYRTFYGSRKTVFTLQAYDLKVAEKWQIVEGLVKATLYGERGIEFGDNLLLQGTLERPPGLRNPGGFDCRRHLARHNIFALLKVKEKDALVNLGDSLPMGAGTASRLSRGASLQRGIFRFKQRLHRIIYRHLGLQPAGLLSAILLGERANLSQDTKDLFIKSGTVHILAISGLHVGLIALNVNVLFGFLRLRRRANFTLSIFILLGYAILSGGRPSVVRATVIAVAILFGLLINREIKIYNALGLAALMILIFNPNYLFDPGFRLSFFSVISIVYFTPKIERLFAARNRFLFYLVRAFSVSSAAAIGIAPVVAGYFNIVTPVAVSANLLIIPWLFLVVAAGLCFLIFTLTWAPLGAVFAQSSELTILGLKKLAEFFARVPFGFFHCPRPTILFIFCYYALLLLVFNYQRLNISLGRLGIILLSAANFLVWSPLLRKGTDKLSVTFFAVGDGDAVFVQFPRRGAMLIDAGPKAETDAGRRVILPFLWNKGIDKIDAVVITHPENDHWGGLLSVLKNIKVNYLFDNSMPRTSLSYRDYKAAIAQKAVAYRGLKAGEQIIGFPQVKLLVLNPPRPLLSGTPADLNNNSVVLKLVYRDVGFIFCADIQKGAIRRMLSYGPLLKSDIIKVPHHGSDEGRAEERLFKEVAAQLAVVSADSDSRFGFPAPEVIASLQELGVEIYQTGKSGAVIVRSDGGDIEAETMTGSLHCHAAESAGAAAQPSGAEAGI